MVVKVFSQTPVLVLIIWMSFAPIAILLLFNLIISEILSENPMNGSRVDDLISKIFRLFSVLPHPGAPPIRTLSSGKTSKQVGKNDEKFEIVFGFSTFKSQRYTFPELSP